MIKRTVMVSEQVTSNGKWIVKEAGIAVFHQFVPGNFPTAIVEFPDGTVESVSIKMIRFIEPLLKEESK